MEFGEGFIGRSKWLFIVKYIKNFIYSNLGQTCKDIVAEIKEGSFFYKSIFMT